MSGITVVDSPDFGGTKGIGSLKVTSPTTVQITMKTIGEDSKVETYTIEYPQGVSNVYIGEWQMQDVEDVFIKLAPDQQDIEQIRPQNGKFYVVFDSFGAEPGELPTLRWDKGREYKGRPWLPERIKFFPLYRIIAGGQFDGMLILDNMTYEFEYDENLEIVTIVGSDRRKYHDKLMTFLNVFGFDVHTDELHFDGTFHEVQDGAVEVPNFLPEIEDVMKSRNKLAEVTVENGWVRDDEGTIEPGPFGMTPDKLVTMMADAGS